MPGVYNKQYQSIDAQKAALKDLYKQQAQKNREITQLREQWEKKLKKLEEREKQLKQKEVELAEQRKEFEAYMEVEQKRISQLGKL